MFGPTNQVVSIIDPLVLHFDVFSSSLREVDPLWALQDQFLVFMEATRKHEHVFVTLRTLR